VNGPDGRTRAGQRDDWWDAIRRAGRKEIRLAVPTKRVRYAAIAAATLFAILIAGFLFIPIPGPMPPIVIDGFVRRLGHGSEVRRVSAAFHAYVAIDHYAVSWITHSLYLFASTRGGMLSGDSSAYDGMYFLIDADGNPATGYPQFNGIGTVAQSPEDPSIHDWRHRSRDGNDRNRQSGSRRSVRAARIAAYERASSEQRGDLLSSRADGSRPTNSSTLTRPCSPIRPFTPSRGRYETVHPGPDAPFTRPFVRPSPFTRPFTRPRPLTRPFTFPAPRVVVLGRAPLTSPLLPRIHPDRNPTAGGTGDGSTGVSSRPVSPRRPLIVASDAHRFSRVSSRANRGPRPSVSSIPLD